MQIAILGRQPHISLAELESLFGPQAVTPLVTSSAALVDTVALLPQARLGGTIKSGTVLARLPAADVAKAYAFVQKHIVEYAAEFVPEGKVQLGTSVYGIPVQTKWLLQQTLTLKKVLKTAGRSVRIIENKAPALETAQVLYNKLARDQGIELLIVKHGTEIIIARTTGVQDIDQYTSRDRGRPKRDARVGMLPPKLAQIIINLAVGPLEAHGATILDPFCGTGVVLQEAQVMGFDAYGTDLEPRMIEYSKTNIEWLQQTHHPIGTGWHIEQADATKTEWPHRYHTIACETYLGRPFSAVPKPEILQEVMQDVNLIHKRFLQNVARQTKPGFRLCVAVPAWFVGPRTKHLKVLEILPELGYTRLEFAHASANELVYHRENQIVGRELVVLVRK